MGVQTTASPEVLSVAPEQRQASPDLENVILTNNAQEQLLLMRANQSAAGDDPGVRDMLKAVTFYDSQGDGSTTVNLSEKQEQRRAELKAAIDALNIPNGKDCPTLPFQTFDAIDNFFWNGGRGDGLIGQRDIDTFLKYKSDSISQSARVGLRWLSEHWNDKDVVALRGGGEHFSKAELLKNPPNLGDPRRPAQPPEQSGQKEDPGFLKRQTLRPGSYNTDKNSPEHNEEWDHNQRWTNKKIEYFIDKNAQKDDIGFTWKGPDGHYMGWKLNTSIPADEGGPRWELYDGNRVRDTKKLDEVKFDEGRGLFVNGKLFNPYQYRHKDD